MPELSFGDAFSDSLHTPRPGALFVPPAVNVTPGSIAGLGAVQSPTVTAGGAPQSGKGLAANRVVFWGNAGEIMGLSNAQLDSFYAQGVRGFALDTSFLNGMGGSHTWTANPNPATWTEMQLWISQNTIVARCHARGMKTYLAFRFSNLYSDYTPLADWFDDATWNNYVLPGLYNVSGAAKNLGMDGIVFDEELYHQPATGYCTWNWNYPGNTHTEAQVRTQARARGVQMMTNILAGFPNVEIIDYATYFSEGWNELVQQVVNSAVDSWHAAVFTQVWDGMLSVNGYGAINFWDATFYKTAHITGTWDYAFQYAYGRHFAWLSRNISNWQLAAPRVNFTPFLWIDGDGGSFATPRGGPYVATQVNAFHRWGMGGFNETGNNGGTIGNFCYNPVLAFDYSGYAAGLNAADVAEVVDTQPPGLTINAVSAGQRTITGTATDNFSIQSVLWSKTGASGSAAMTWVVISGDYTNGYVWRMDWTATIPSAGAVTVTATDTKGLTTSASVTLT